MRRSDAGRAVTRATVTVLTVAVTTGLMMTTGAAGASATDCGRGAPVTDVLQGTVKPLEGPLETGDYAVVGRVTAINELPEPTASPRPTPSPSRGKLTSTRFGPDRYEVVVSALAYFAGPDLGPQLRFTTKDRGGLYSYPFQVGQVYFIPVRDDGNLGALSLCAGIHLLPVAAPELERDIPGFITLATAHGMTAAQVTGPRATSPAAAPGPATAPAVRPVSSEAYGVSPWPLGLIAGGTLCAAALTLLLRRRGSAPDG